MILLPHGNPSFGWRQTPPSWVFFQSSAGFHYRKCLQWCPGLSLPSTRVDSEERHTTSMFWQISHMDLPTTGSEGLCLLHGQGRSEHDLPDHPIMGWFVWYPGSLTPGLSLYIFSHAQHAVTSLHISLYSNLPLQRRHPS